MSRNKKGRVTIIKSEEKASLQIAESKTSYGDDVLSPSFDFDDLITIYENSYLGKGIVDKVSSAVLSGFDGFDDDKKSDLKDVIEAIDFEALVKCLLTTGNAFFEAIRSKDGDRITKLIPIPVRQVRVKRDGKKVVQIVGTERQEFHIFGKRGTDTALNEVYHFKTLSLSDNYYGTSIFTGSISQLCLLKNIDIYYRNLFDNGLIKPNILTDVSNNLNSRDREALKEFFNEKLKGNDNSFSTAIVPADLKRLDLIADIDDKAFLEFRKELELSICASLNIPYDLIRSENSNRSTSEVSQESFNKYMVKPLQKKILRSLKEIFHNYEGIELLQFKEIDTKNAKEEADTLVAYKNAGIMSVNEVREKLGLKPIEDGDKYITSGNFNLNSKKEVEKTFKSVIDEINDTERDFYGSN